MVIFPSILVISLIGIFLVTRPYRSGINSYPQAELKKLLVRVPSMRSQVWSKVVGPSISKSRELALPLFMRVFGRSLGHVRVWVSKLESKLNTIADDIHGTAINLNIPEKSEYWQNLNIAKTANAHHDIIPKRIK
jgi:hypothetical protein